MELIEQKNLIVKNLSRALLATTCLTAASGLAAADTIITEGITPAPIDFGNTIGAAYVLPDGTITVFGVVNQGDPTDYVEFQNLTAGLSFTLTGQYQEAGDSTYIVPFASEGAPIPVTGLNTEGRFAGFGSLEGAGAVLQGTVPSDGEIFVEIHTLSTEEGGAYILNLTANTSSMPEPSTFSGTGLALAGALAWRRKRPRKV